MKLRNKKTGGIIDAVMTGENEIEFQERGSLDRYTYSSLAELNEEWEDYDEAEPKKYWYLTGRGGIDWIEDDDSDFDNDHKEIGNYFETKEEAERAAEKLKAWKRLSDKGLQPVNCTVEHFGHEILVQYIIEQPYNEKDLVLLFEGKE